MERHEGTPIISTDHEMLQTPLSAANFEKASEYQRREEQSAAEASFETTAMIMSHKLHGCDSRVIRLHARNSQEIESEEGEHILVREEEGTEEK